MGQRAMELERAEKPLRQMRRLLKRMAENPAPGKVHRLRTRARKIEAIAGELGAGDMRATKRLLKAIKPVRKAAGAVRDMDVLMSDLLQMPKKELGASQAKLHEHLGTVRRASADKLMAVIGEQRQKARKRLKSYARVVESATSVKKPVQRADSQAMESGTRSDSRAGLLVVELTRWPALSHQNLHAFRLKVKELRYVLQLFPQADEGFIQALGKVKDQIGGWHDWEHLLAIAREVLDAQADGTLLEHIEATARRRFMQALAGANAMRLRYLDAGVAGRAAS